MSQVKYPQSVLDQLRQIQRKCGASFEEVQDAFYYEFEDSKQKAQAQYRAMTPERMLEIRYTYAVGRVASEFVTKKEAVKSEIIYLGHGGLRKNKKGGDYSNMFGMFQDEKEGIKLIQMFGKGEGAKSYQGLNLFDRYVVTAVRHRGGNLTIDDDSIFVNNTPPDKTVMAYTTLNDLLKIREIKINEVDKNLSVKSRGWVVKTDWRCIIGTANRDPNEFERKKEGTPGCVLSIRDETVGVEEVYVDQFGNPVFPGFTVFGAPEVLIYGKDSICAYYGTIDSYTKDDETNTNMSAYLVIPIVGSLVEG